MQSAAILAVFEPSEPLFGVVGAGGLHVLRLETAKRKRWTVFGPGGEKLNHYPVAMRLMIRDKETTRGIFTSRLMKTDSKGTLSLDGLGGLRDCRVWLAPEMYASAMSAIEAGTPLPRAEISLAGRDAGRDGYELRLADWKARRITVRSEDGGYLRGATLVTRSGMHANWGKLRDGLVRSDKRGRLVWFGRESSAALWVVHERIGFRRINTKLLARSAPDHVEAVSLVAGKKIDVRVVDHDGRPLEMVHCAVLNFRTGPTVGGGNDVLALSRIGLGGITDKQGRVSLWKHPEARWQYQLSFAHGVGKKRRNVREWLPEDPKDEWVVRFPRAQ